MTTTTEEPTVTDTTWLGSPNHGRTVTPVQLEGETLYRDSAGTYHRACGRCGGQGKLPEYGHVYAGECFECGEAGVRRFADDEAGAIKKLRKNARAAARRDAARQAEVDAHEAARRSPEAIDRCHDEALRIQAQLDAKVAKAAASRHEGTVGDRVTVTGEVKVAMDIEGEDFRTGRPITKRFCIVTTDDGVTLKLAGTAQALYDMVKGDAVTITATVKAHTIGRDGEAVTTAIRPKLV